MSNANVIDLAGLRSKVGDDDAFTLEILGDMKEELAEGIVKMKMPLDASELEYVASVAHCIKGSAAYVKAGVLNDVASRMNEACKRGDLEASKGIFRELLAAQTVFIAELQRISGENGPGL